MILTVDIGNSRIKWASWQASVIIARGVAAYDKKNPAAVFDQLFAELGASSSLPPRHVFAVSVAQKQVVTALNDWVKQHWALNVEYLKTEKHYQNISNAYQNPEQHGADRWAAVVAAHQRFPGFSICVVSAGTATTFDLIDKNGQHLGGYILPSYATMHAALIADTAAVEAEWDMQLQKDSVPANTHDAVNQGLHRLIQAGIADLCQLAKTKMNEPMKIIVTGGFAKIILEYPELPAMIFEPDLVMHGVFNIMRPLHENDFS